MWALDHPISGPFVINPTKTTTGLPVSGHWYNGALEISGGDSRRISVTDEATDITYTNVTVAGQWRSWKRIATAEPPTEYNVPFASEFVDRGQINDGIYASKYSKDQFGRVFVQISVQTVPFENTLQNAIGVGTIPVGFRPSRALVSTIEGSILTGGKTVGSFLVGTDGKIAISTAAKCAFAHGQITYLAAP